MKDFLYSVERVPFGWLVCAPPRKSGIPIDAMSEVSRLFPKNAVMNMGIPHHYNMSGRETKVIFAVSTPQDSKTWVEDIEDSLKFLPSEERWFRGTGVGRSSATIFGVLSKSRYAGVASEQGEGLVPADAADFERCRRLIDLMPEWRNRLGEVGAKFPGSKWPEIVARWDELASATPAQQNSVLRSL